MSRTLVVLIAFILVCAGAGAAVLVSPKPAADPSDDSIYQVSTLDSLARGQFGEVINVDELLEHGTFGLGTFTGLDGEMIVLDGRCYQASVDGQVSEAEGGLGVTFAQVAYFSSDGSMALNGSFNLSMAEAAIGDALPSQGCFFVLRIDGVFEEMEVRSVPKQAEPYPSLADVVANQTVFRYFDITGTLVAVWTPELASTISPAGFHFHFISEDRQKGGHVLGFTLTDPAVQWDQISLHVMKLS